MLVNYKLCGVTVDLSNYFQEFNEALQFIYMSISMTKDSDLNIFFSQSTRIIFLNLVQLFFLNQLNFFFI